MGELKQALNNHIGGGQGWIILITLRDRHSYFFFSFFFFALCWNRHVSHRASDPCLHSMLNIGFTGLHEQDAESFATQEKALLARAWQETGTEKLGAVKNYITELIESGEKFLVFAHHMQGRVHTESKNSHSITLL